MPRNSVGTYTLPQSPFTPGSVISSAAVNSDFSDIASALTGSVATNGVTPITAPLKNPSGTAALPGISFSAFTTMGLYPVSAGILGVAAGGVAIAYFDNNKVGTSQDGNQFYYANTAIPSPVGSITDFAGSTAPAGWLLCYGQSLLRTDYPELFTVIGTTYGAADGTHFSVPDCRGRVGAGRDDMGGSAANRVTTAGSGVDGITLGATGGAQNEIIGQACLPNVSFTVTIGAGQGSHTHALNNATGVLRNTGGGNLTTTLADSLAISDITESAATLPAMSGTAASGGSGTALTTMPPAIIFNKIIFAGRP